MRVFRDFKEVESAVGTEVGVSGPLDQSCAVASALLKHDWVEMTQQRIDQFAEATGDEQWIHVDVERAARELPGRTTIAHGLLTLSLAPLFSSAR
jgi:acyl dehydratase